MQIVIDPLPLAVRELGNSHPVIQIPKTKTSPDIHCLQCATVTSVVTFALETWFHKHTEHCWLRLLLVHCCMQMFYQYPVFIATILCRLLKCSLTDHCFLIIIKCLCSET